MYNMLKNNMLRCENNCFLNSKIFRVKNDETSYEKTTALMRRFVIISLPLQTENHGDEVHEAKIS